MICNSYYLANILRVCEIKDLIWVMRFQSPLVYDEFDLIIIKNATAFLLGHLSNRLNVSFCDRYVSSDNLFLKHLNHWVKFKSISHKCSSKGTLLKLLIQQIVPLCEQKGRQSSR